jgi:Tol biopolymer transport system component
VIGTTISHYHITERLGGGGMGVVYKARDLRLDRFVALKFLPEQMASNPLALERFQREARAIAAMDHPSICTIYDIGEHEGRPFLAMQLLVGQTLRERVSGGPLPISDILDYGIQIAEGLEKAHSRNIIHRDIKPANIFITTDGHAKILDFGLAKSHGPAGELSTMPTATADPLTSQGTIVGTFAYMSPEQAQGQDLDSRTDLFSFGAVLYEMATGQCPFAGKTTASVFDGILNKTPVTPVRLNPEVPVRLEEIIAKTLEKDRGVRFQSAAEIRADLKRLKRDTDSGQMVPASGARATAAGLPSRTKTKAIVVLLGVAAVAIVGLFVWTRQPSPAPVLLTERKLTRLFESSGALYHQALSSDGKVVAYGMEEDGQVDLYVSRTAGGARVRLTHDATVEWYPQFSPDGETLVFTRLAVGTEKAEICMTPTFGGNVTCVTAGSGAGWSPDGKRIVFVAPQPDGAQALAIADRDGSNIRTILKSDSTFIGLRDPTWSPEGDRIAVVRSIGGSTGEIWMVPAEGGSPTQLWKDEPGVYSHRPVFTYDGRGIVHSSNRGGATNIWLLPLDGRAPVRLTAGAGPDEYPSIARDGTIAFANTRLRWGLFLHDTNVGKSTSIIAHGSVLWAPSATPDGTELAYSQNEPDGSWHIWIVSVGGGTPRQLTSGSLPEVYPRVTPDGKWILYSTFSSSKPNQVWRVPRTGGVPIAVTSAGMGDDGYADISPDGKLIAFARTERGVSHVYIVPFEGGEPRRLMERPATLPRWSPDGKWIAFAPDRTYTGGVYVVAPDGSGMRNLTQQGGWPVWWPDGKRIAYLAISPYWNQQVQSVPLEGGPPSVLPNLSFNGTNYPIDVFGKGLLATTNSVHLNTEIWLSSPIEPRGSDGGPTN